MEIGSLLLVLAVVVAVGLFVAQPYLERRQGNLAPESQEISSLMAERDRIINALHELDFDYTLNKIPAEDYPVQRAALLQKGSDILQKLDALTAASEPIDTAEDRVEKAVAARRADTASNAPASALDDDNVEALIAGRRAARKEKSGGFCPRCGKPVLLSDRFCPHCGKSIS
jgi:NADH pyrophosphatase NudC (nudix superfamily)